jgi:hypothetical protein
VNSGTTVRHQFSILEMVCDFSVHLVFDSKSEEFRVLAKCDLAGDAEGSMPAAVLQKLYQEQEWLATEQGANATRKEAVEAGQALFTALMGAKVRSCFTKATEGAWEKGDRLRFVLELSADAREMPPWVHEVQWELMYDPDRDRFLALDPDVLLVRYLRQARPLPAPAALARLKILATSACPKGEVQLDLDREMLRLDQMFRWPAMAGRVRHKLRRDISISALRGELVEARRMEQPFHVWHHCGHGRFDAKSGEYQLALAAGATGAGELTRLIHECAELRLVVLNVCLGARPSGLATLLAGLGIPAVVGYSVPVEDRVALGFSREFWRAFATVPADEAMQRARQMLAGSHQQLAFAHAILYLRSLEPVRLTAENQITE